MRLAPRLGRWTVESRADSVGVDRAPRTWLLFDFDFDGLSATGKHGVEDRDERQYQDQFGLLGHTENFDRTALSDYDTGRTRAGDWELATRALLRFIFCENSQKLYII
ncbi:hypothetical protein GCM10007209_19060 [Haloferax sulfurifontis]|uniref:Uncharacterized protein n=1 Tax=Haloferax sulfurifontis TaxID=255616 RepID=A0A830E5W6_9EURY|nr:hypothetical protein GCM10007209_19060 [Haloferax sulfurifontis]